MLLDCGNSRLKWTQWDGRTFSAIAHCDRQACLDLDAVWCAYTGVLRVIACNVSSDQIVNTVNAWCHKHQIAIDWIESTYPFTHLSHTYQQPTKLGNDRWVAMAGARQHYPGLICLVDCGTATTFDVVDASGQHRGGAIVPGISTMRKALAQHAYDLPLVDDAQVSVANNTHEAIGGGTRLAVVAFIDRLTAETGLRYHSPTTLLLCGGEANSIYPLLEQRAIVDPLLVFKGLVLTTKSL